VNDTSSAFYKKRKIPLYDREVFQDIGRSYLISLLDITFTNPITRILKEGSTDTLESAIDKIRAEVKRDSERDSIKKMKLKQKKLMSKKKSKEVEFELIEKPFGTEVDDDDNEATAATTGGDQEEESKEI
jgi:hypothetical protein